MTKAWQFLAAFGKKTKLFGKHYMLTIIMSSFQFNTKLDLKFGKTNIVQCMALQLGIPNLNILILSWPRGNQSPPSRSH